LAVNVEKKPTAAFALSILAGIFTLVGSFVASAIGSLLVPGFPSSLLLIWGSIAGVLVLVGSWLLYNNAAQRKLGSTLVLLNTIHELHRPHPRPHRRLPRIHLQDRRNHNQHFQL
jgi:hypothetical protein